MKKLIFLLLTFVQYVAAEVLYFGYGSNLSHNYLIERLKDGVWVDNFHKSGPMPDPVPVDLGCYVLNDYEFAYLLNVEPFGHKGTAATVLSKKGAKVYGVLYSISEQQLSALDITEKTPEAYTRILVNVQQGNCTRQAWVYIGNSKYIVDNPKPHPRYIELLLKGAQEHGLPVDYVENFLQSNLVLK